MAEIHQEMSELLDKQVNAQKEKSFWGSRKLPQAHKKCVMKINKKRHACKNVIDGRKPFIRSIQKTGENDLHELQVVTVRLDTRNTVTDIFYIKTHDSESRGQKEAGLHDKNVSYLHVVAILL